MDYSVRVDWTVPLLYRVGSCPIGGGVMIKDYIVSNVNTSNAILALCGDVMRRGPKTYIPYDPRTARRVNHIIVNIPKYADWEDYQHLAWLLDHPRKQITCNYTRAQLGAPIVEKR